MLPRCRPPCTPHSLRQGLVPRGWEDPLPLQPSLHWDGFPILQCGPMLSTPRFGSVAPCALAMLPAYTGRCEAKSAAQGGSRHVAGKPRAHMAPDLATVKLLKIARSQDAGELHLLAWGADRELWLSSCGAGVLRAGVLGAGVLGAGVHRAGPSTVQLQECLESPAWKDAAIPGPAWEQDTRTDKRCSQGWDSPNPPGN